MTTQTAIPADTTTAAPPRGIALRRAIVAALVALAVSLVALLSTTPAEARVIQAQGIGGGSAPGSVDCLYYNYTGRLTIRTMGPVAYAANRNAGWGNDRQIVRYRIVWYSYFNGSVLKTSGWSGYVWATDNAPASWSGYTVDSFRYDAQVMVGTQIQFYNGTTGQYEGVVTHIQDTYQNYQEDQRAGVSSGRCVSAWGNIS